MVRVRPTKAKSKEADVRVRRKIEKEERAKKKKHKCDRDGLGLSAGGLARGNFGEKKKKQQNCDRAGVGFSAGEFCVSVSRVESLVKPAHLARRISTPATYLDLDAASASLLQAADETEHFLPASVAPP